MVSRMTMTSQMAANENSRDDNAMLNQNELKSVRSLVAYQAYTKRMSEEAITNMFSQKFNVKEIGDLPSSRYEDAIKFLVDLDLLH